MLSLFAAGRGMLAVLVFAVAFLFARSFGAVVIPVVTDALLDLLRTAPERGNPIAALLCLLAGLTLLVLHQYTRGQRPVWAADRRHTR